jgi:Protein of unknown function (DUF3224)
MPEAADGDGKILKLVGRSAREQREEGFVTNHATGTFEVKMTPQAPDEGGEPAVGRMLLDKQFRGDLEAAGRGQMLAARTALEGSAGYVAIERVEGTLGGRRGSFVLQHSGTMTRGVPQLIISVVPDSGTEQLAGLAGRMSIDIAGGRHSYAFEYTIGEDG